MTGYISAALFNDTSNDGHFGCDLVMSALERYLIENKIEVCFHHYVENDWRLHRKIQSGDVKADIVIVNGEGTIHHPATWARAAILAKVGPYAKNVLRVPSFLINATIDEIDRKTAEDLSCFDKIYVRDTYSQTHLKSFGIASSVVPDLSLASNIKCPIPDGVRNGICGTDSVFPDVAKDLRERSRKNEWVYVPISRFWNPEMNLIGSPQDYADILMSKSLVVTGRYHVATICLFTKTPFVAVDSNTAKISALVDDVFGSNFRVISRDEIFTFDPNNYASWSPKELDQVLNYRHHAVQSIAQMFFDIKNYCSETAANLSAA